MGNVLHIEKIKLGYANASVTHFFAQNLSVKLGEIVALLGPNGSGKSTLIKTIAHIIPPLSGEIFIENKSISKWDIKDLSRKIALVLTDRNFSGLMTVESFVAFGRYPFTNWLGKLKAEDVNAIEESILQCEIEDIRLKDMDSLSDGERQKVLLARAIAQQADFLVLDEPTTHLDAKNTVIQLRLIRNLSRNKGKTILFSSHQFELALQIADKLWLIDGENVHQITPQEFYENERYQKVLLGEDYTYNKNQQRFILNL